MLRAIEETIMQNILEKNKPTEKKQTGEQPRTVMAAKLTKIRELLDRNGNVVKRTIEEPK